MGSVKCIQILHSFVFVAIRKNWTHQFPTQCNECKHNIPSKHFKHGLKFSETEEGIVLCMVGCLFGIRAIVHIVLCQGNIKNEKIVLSLPFGCLLYQRHYKNEKIVLSLGWFYDEGRPSEVPKGFSKNPNKSGGDRVGHKTENQQRFQSRRRRLFCLWWLVACLVSKIL